MLPTEKIFCASANMLAASWFNCAANRCRAFLACPPAPVNHQETLARKNGPECAGKLHTKVHEAAVVACNDEPMARGREGPEVKNVLEASN